MGEYQRHILSLSLRLHSMQEESVIGTEVVEIATPVPQKAKQSKQKLGGTVKVPEIWLFLETSGGLMEQNYKLQSGIDKAKRGEADLRSAIKTISL